MTLKCSGRLPRHTPLRSGDTFTREEVQRIVDRITRQWARDCFDETNIQPLPPIDAERIAVGLGPFSRDEIHEFNP